MEAAQDHAQPHAAQPIVFFDGVCGLCDGFVQWLLAHDRRGRMKVAPLQGETARAHLGELSPDPCGWTLVLVAGAATFERSDAVLQIVQRMGAPWSLLACLRWVPRPLRDGVYRFVAAHRYRWFGKRAACRLPTSAEAERFLP